MTQSVFKVRTLESIYEEIRTVYLDDARPWILGFSGGKDSTCMVQLVWNALSKLPAEKLEKKIYIVSSDTLVESPQIVERITSSLDSSFLIFSKIFAWPEPPCNSSSEFNRLLTSLYGIL